MTDISKYVRLELIVTDIECKTKEEAIKLLLDRVFQVKPDYAKHVSKEDAYKELLERENMQTTGLGQGTAFPHARISGWTEFVIALGIVKNGVDFNSLDKSPAKFVCLMISSTEEPYIILQAMASIIRFLQETNMMKNITEEASGEEIAAAFRDYNITTEKVIKASDIMRPVKASVNLDTVVEEAARIMHLNHLDVLPVVDNDNKICGQISCMDMFTYGIPNFFKQLKTVSFVRHIDPFEKYFKIKKTLAVKDVYNKNCAVISEDATLLEIIFELAVKNELKLFVADDESGLMGEIDRFSVIDKVLFF